MVVPPARASAAAGRGVSGEMAASNLEAKVAKLLPCDCTLSGKPMPHLIECPAFHRKAVLAILTLLPEVLRENESERTD